MRARRGFTLLELMVGLVISGLVVTLGYSTLQGGLDTEARLTTHRLARESTLATRTMIADALRHGVPGVPGGPAVFVIVDRFDANGVPSDSLTFLSRGIVPPLGTSATWQVALQVTGDSLRFVAWPSEATSVPPVVATVGVGRGFDVQVLGRGVLSAWTTRWPDPGVAPDAVRLSIGDSQPLVVRTGLERTP